MESRPFTETDPCTGRCQTVYKPCPVLETVKVTVSDRVPVQRQVVVKVPVLRPGKELVVRKLVLDQATEPAVKQTYRAVTTPNKIKTLLPVPHVVPAPNPCPPPCHPHGAIGPAHGQSAQPGVAGNMAVVPASESGFSTPAGR
jgi:hypothetical protein